MLIFYFHFCVANKRKFSLLSKANEMRSRLEINKKKAIYRIEREKKALE